MAFQKLLPLLTFILVLVQPSSFAAPSLPVDAKGKIPAAQTAKELEKNTQSVENLVNSKNTAQTTKKQAKTFDPVTDTAEAELVEQVLGITPATKEVKQTNSTTTTLYYDSQGRLIGSLQRRDISSGARLVSDQWEDSKGRFVQKTVFIYDSTGKLVRVRLRTKSGLKVTINEKSLLGVKYTLAELLTSQRIQMIYSATDQISTRLRPTTKQFKVENMTLSPAPQAGPFYLTYQLVSKNETIRVSFRNDQWVE